jgi:hypothetical protein
VNNSNYMDVEDLEVYKKLCRLHIDVCDLTHKWHQEEKYELGSQARRSSNSAPTQLAEESAVYGVNDETLSQGWPITAEQAS